MNTSRDPDVLIRAFVEEGITELPDSSYDVVRASIEDTRQRVVFGPWREELMSKFVAIGIAAAAVVLVAVVAIQFLPRDGGGVGGPPAATATPTTAPTEVPTQVPTEAPTPTPTRAPDAGLPMGPHILSNPADSYLEVTVDVASAGWEPLPQYSFMSKGDDDAGVGLFAFHWPTGYELFVYGDACHWSTTIPETPATTVDEFVTALAAQASRDATPPMDVKVGGYRGKSITLHVPDDMRPANCDATASDGERRFTTFGDASGPVISSFDPGVDDQFWVLDVEGSIVVLVAWLGNAPADLVEEVQALAESATFVLP